MTNDKKPIKLMFTITDLVYGGGQTVIAKLLPHIDREKFSPVLVALTAGNTDLANLLRRQNISVYDLKMNKRWVFPALWRYYWLVKKEQPLLIHSSLFHANITSRLIGRLAGVPRLVSWRQNVELGSNLREQINRLTTEADDKVVAVCIPAREAEIKRGNVQPQKVVVIPNCVDVELIKQQIEGVDGAELRSSLEIAPDEKVLLSIGRLHPQKGLHHLLDAFALIIEKENVPSDLRLVLVGEGPLENELKEQAQRLGIADHVTFTGGRTDIPALLNIADIFILSSLWEGLPLVILEAMAAELPVIATDVGGTPEAIINGQTGLLIPAGDTVQLAERVLQLLSDDPLCKTLAANALRKVSLEFSAETVAKQLQDLYLTLISPTDQSNL
ncbi:MAG: glycosyltransferase [Chloroflexota bacterium]